MDKNLRTYLAELCGTFALVFVSASVVCADVLARMSDLPRPGLIGIALAQGLILAAALAMTLPHNGGYLNPAITIVLWVNNRLHGGKAIGLIFCQLLGAAAAGGLVRLGYTELVLDPARLGTPHLNLATLGYPADATPPFLATLGGVAMEMALTFVLTLIIFATIIDPRAQKSLGPTTRRMIAFWVGLAMVGLVLAGFNLTGAAVNPARWFGTVVWEKTVPSLMRNPYADHVVYWMGPILGGLLAGQLYTWLILPTDQAVAEQAAHHHHGGKVASGASSTLFRAKK